MTVEGDEISGRSLSERGRGISRRNTYSSSWRIGGSERAGRISVSAFVSSATDHREHELPTHVRMISVKRVMDFHEMRKYWRIGKSPKSVAAVAWWSASPGVDQHRQYRPTRAQVRRGAHLEDGHGCRGDTEREASRNGWNCKDEERVRVYSPPSEEGVRSLCGRSSGVRPVRFCD